MSTAIAARIGTTDVGAHQVTFELWSTMALGLDALAIAGQSLVGHHLGAGDPVAARVAGRRLLELGLYAGVAAALVLAGGRFVLPDLFTDDVEVARLAAFVLWWAAALQPVNALVFVLDGLLIGAGDMRFLAGAMSAALAVFAVAGGAVLVADAGLGWLWAAIGVFMVARLVPLAIRWRKGGWAVVGASSLRSASCRTGRGRCGRRGRRLASAVVGRRLQPTRSGELPGGDVAEVEAAERIRRQEGISVAVVEVAHALGLAVGHAVATRRRRAEGVIDAEHDRVVGLVRANRQRCLDVEDAQVEVVVDQVDAVTTIVDQAQAEGVVDRTAPRRERRRQVELGEEHEQGRFDLGIRSEHLLELHLAAGHGVLDAPHLLDAVVRDTVDVAAGGLVHDPEPRRRPAAVALAVP